MKTLTVLFVIIIAFIFLLVISPFLPILKTSASGLRNITNTSQFSEGEDIFGSGGSGSGSSSGQTTGCQNIELSDKAAIFFEHEDCNLGKDGFVFDFQGQKLIKDLDNIPGTDDEITSLMVKEGYKVTLYEHDKGDWPSDRITFYGPEKVKNLEEHEWFGGGGENWNDDSSAIRIESYNPSTDEPIVIIYKSENYMGSNRPLYSAVGQCKKLSDLQFGDEVSSIKINGDYTVELYEREDCDVSTTEEKITLTSSSSSLSNDNWESLSIINS
ncbi:MAG: hypothetical protein ABEK36_02240 [Candidatus Aenigmatarchaeota archaeon]